MTDAAPNLIPEPQALERFAQELIRGLTAAGYRALLAGGCVRDMLLKQRPKDYDVATSARPEQIIDLFPRTVPVGVAFGVVRVLSPGANPLQVEVATFRGEQAYSDGRHPDSVYFTDEQGDAQRRDFTINGLFFDVLRNEVLDYVNGQRDLERRIVRCIGDPKERFREDHLRMLRAIRFATRLSFELDGATLGAIKDAAALIASISAERIRDELVAMLTGPDPRRALELLKSARLLKHILPEVDALEGVEQPPQFHPEGDVWTHTLMLLEQLEQPNPTLALGALFHDIGKPATFEQTDRIRFNEHERVGANMTRVIMERLRFSNDEIAQVESLVKQHMAFKDVLQMRPATLKRFIRQPRFEEHLELHRADCLASHGDLSAYEFCKTQAQTQPPESLRPTPLLTGEDLIALGMKPGPDFKSILKDLEDAQLEGRLADKAAALEFVRQWRRQ